MRLRILIVFLFGCCSLFSARADGSLYAAQSVLSEGKWVKIKVAATDIYKLTYADLRGMGFADPSKVSVFGYGGWPLNEDFTKPYTDDLPVVPLWRESDYILFYAKGPVKWEWNQTKGEFNHTNNPYATAGYYFLTDAIAPVGMEEVESVSGAMLTVNTYDDYFVHEAELASVNYSGRELYGESFESTTTRSFNMQVPGIVNEPGKATLSFIARPEKVAGAVTLSIGSETVVSTAVPAVAGLSNASYTKAREAYATSVWSGNKTPDFTVKILYGLSQDKNARLNYFRLQVKRELRAYNASTLFRNLASIGQSTRFAVQGADANTLVFDVTDGASKRMKATLSGSELSFAIPAGALREFAIAQKDRTFPKPEKVADVSNQNLHALPQIDMVIIASPPFHAQAERLADLHRSPGENLKVEVVDPQTIYNEFSSGTPDATAYRRFLKMFYDRGVASANPPKYLLLFGDGIYDNRGISSDNNMSGLFKEYGDRLLLTYQSKNSLDIDSYVTDDYFGFLLDGSGTNLANDKLCIGIGRLPVRTEPEASAVVDKLLGYANNTLFGTWKNNLAFVADDGSGSDGYTKDHMEQADNLTEIVERQNPEFLVNKVYLDAYKKEFINGKARYPTVDSKIQRLLKDGLLVLNYSGHGDTRSWTEERIMTEAEIVQSSYPSLPLWITATCDFTRFDDATTSAGEQVLLNKTSGGIGLFTTTRVVYSLLNYYLNAELIKHLFAESGIRYTLGEVMERTKNARGNDANKLNFILIGDPAMKLAYPENRMKVTTVNGRPVSEGPFTFKAFEKVTIEGVVEGADGKHLTDFNGVATPTVFDSKKTVKTLDNNGSGPFTYTDYTVKLYTGNEAVSDGAFRFTFEVPKFISYSGEYGKMNLYGVDETTGLEAQGVFLDYKLEGTNSNAEEDTDGPEIRAMFLNDSTFTDGGKVNTTPLFAARVWDKSGVNITGSSLGHDIMLIIDEQPTRSYSLNSYYEPVTGSDGEGYVMFSIPALAPGMHTAEFIVWDIRSNSSRDTLTFEVVEGLKPSLIRLYANPNPARQQVDFRLDHNRPETRMEVSLMVYNTAGRLLWQHAEKGSSELFKSYIVTWNLTDKTGSRLLPGLYFYRAAIRSNGSKEATKANKLIILAQ